MRVSAAASATRARTIPPLPYNRLMESLPSPDDAGTVIVGMSGGVDSAVSALLLKRAGFDVQGLFMANWDDDGYCTTAADFQDAREVCNTLDLPLHRVSFAADYRERVFAHFLREYAAGRTPNPDVLCNREIKFGVCLDYMHRLGASLIATGHYARVRRVGDAVRLLKAADRTKDQSYFLHQVTAGALHKPCFPSALWIRAMFASWRMRPDCRCSTSPTARAFASSAKDPLMNS